MKKTAIALGTFDGVHAGHRAVLSAAADSGYTPVAVAFRVPPKSFFTQESIILTEEGEKTRFIKETGIEQIDYIDFPAVKNVSPEDFFSGLVKKYSPALIVCGYDYTFGKGAGGDTALLYSLCKEKGIELKVVNKVSINGVPVSSSLIRSLLKEGKVKEAANLLPHGFSVCGEVLHGDERGRTIDFPTFNQCYPPDKAPVKHGVYLTKALINGKLYFGMTNIGIRPTFPLDAPLCETNLFGFTGDLYGKTVRLYLLDFIREEKKFSSLDELKKAIAKDRKTIEEILKNQ